MCPCYTTLRRCRAIVGELQAAGIDLTKLGPKAEEPALCGVCEECRCEGVAFESGGVCELCEPLSWIWLPADVHERIKPDSHWRDLGARWGNIMVIITRYLNS